MATSASHPLSGPSGQLVSVHPCAKPRGISTGPRDKRHCAQGWPRSQLQICPTAKSVANRSRPIWHLIVATLANKQKAPEETTIERGGTPHRLASGFSEVALVGFQGG